MPRGVCAYAFAQSRGSDLGRARAAGTRAGALKATRTAELRGYARGYREGTRVGIKQTFRRAYDKAFQKVRVAPAAVPASTPAAAASTQQPPPRPTGCHVPLFVDGYCPTKQEIQRELQAENHP